MALIIALSLSLWQAGIGDWKQERARAKAEEETMKELVTGISRAN